MTFGEMDCNTSTMRGKVIEHYVFRRGMHEGQTFKQVAENIKNEQYCDWVKRQGDLKGAMAVFREYLLSRD